MPEAPKIKVGDEAPLNPGVTYAAGTTKKIAFDTAHGPCFFPCGDDGRPTATRVWTTHKKTGKKVRVVARMSDNPDKSAGIRAMLSGKRSCLDDLRDDEPDMWDRVEALFARNESSHAIAKAIHRWGGLQKTSFDTLKKSLERHRKRAFSQRMKKLGDPNSDLDFAKNITRVDVVETLETLVGFQKLRLDKIMRRENEMGPAGMLLKQVSDEMDRTIDMSLKLANLYFDTGIMARAPKVMKGMIATADLTGNFIDPIRGARIVSFELQESELAEIEGIRDELGRYFVPAPA